jgi:hypothetical protein
MGEWQQERQRRNQARRGQVMRLPVLAVRQHGVLAGRDGDVLACASPGPAGEMAAVWTTGQDREAVTATARSPAGASFPAPGAGRPVAARVTVCAPELVAVTQIRDLRLAHVMVQPMPGGRFLIAGARCAWHDGGPEANAVLYGADGQVISAHVLGDGIAHLQATVSGQVWAGYFDEGIYGNYGWGRPGTSEPLGAPGILRFSPDLGLAWQFPPCAEAGPWGPVDDCYALNAGDDGTWACYDSGFPVVRIRDGIVTGWHNGIRGASALAVAGSRVALAGGYGPDRDRLAVTGLGQDRARPAGEFRLVLPGGQQLPDRTQVTGRGSCLHFLAGTRWYQLDVNDIPG